MSQVNTDTRKAADALRRITAKQGSLGKPLSPRVPGSADHSRAAAELRRELLRKQGISTDFLARDENYASPESLAGNIENFVGFARVPVGVIGPLRIQGAAAQGDFYIPMATTEGAMLASYQRGSQAISRVGGATTVCLNEAVSRSPVFCFEQLADVGEFLGWLVPTSDQFQEIVATSSRHCKLIDIRTNVMGKDVYIAFEFTTGDASGQNMITIATEKICKWILARAPVQPTRWFLEANCSGDKKSSMQSMQHVRGKKVVAEVTLDRKTVHRFLHTDPETMVHFWASAAVGALQSGTFGVQGHYSNALAGLFIATGQDVACVSEAHIGVTQFDVTSSGDLYASVCLPNLIVGTVGGGTRFPTQRECLEMMGCYGAGTARKFAEICAATALAGELSISAALAAGHFAQAHATYGRRPQDQPVELESPLPKPHFPVSDARPVESEPSFTDCNHQQ